MKKLVIPLILSLCVTSLVGCSNNKKAVDTLVWDHGTLMNGDSIMEVTSYNGYEAEDKQTEYTITYTSCTGPTNCPHKIQDVGKDLMTKYNGTYYFTAFFETMCEMYYPVDESVDCWNEGTFGVNGDNSYPVATMVSIMEPVLKELPLDGSVTKINVNNCVEINVAGSTYNVTPDVVSIPGYLKAGTDDGSIKFDHTVTFGETTVAYTSSSKYNYYSYGDVIIQVAQGLDITQYVTFLAEES